MTSISHDVRLDLNADAYLETLNLLDGSFSPLTGFMDDKTFQSVVNTMRLPDGRPWTIPVILDVSAGEAQAADRAEQVTLCHEGRPVARLCDARSFAWDAEFSARHVFGTDDARHPGVRRMLGAKPFLLGGAVVPYEGATVTPLGLTPVECRALIRERGWHRVAGFQTRNPPHRAHEYLQRMASEVCDGLLLQPIVGWKQPGDFRPETVMAVYERMIEWFYPADRVILTGLRTAMRYAGPREAVFHALIRRNYGCTHFVVGRDHAGVMGFYGPYDAHRLCERFDDLGIEVMAMAGPRYCRRCSVITTERTCRHDGGELLEISGTIIRALLREGRVPPPEMMRPEIARLLLDAHAKGELFC